MPEGPEIRIMNDFINHQSSDHKFVKAYHVAKGNKPQIFEQNESLEKFDIKCAYYGKKLILHLKNDDIHLPIYVFMGMSGNWKLVDTNQWSDVKFTRLRFDRSDGKSLLLYGGYMGPKYSLYTNFKSASDGYDMTIDFDKFVDKIYQSLNDKTFKKPIYEVLLDQKYFAGVGNYLRSTILYYADVDPFLSAKDILDENPKFLNLCKEILEESYKRNGGQLKDWQNPFQHSSESFDMWVYYQKGEKIKDSNGRSFWYHPKWKA